MNKIALITGVTGQDGSYLSELLLEKGIIKGNFDCVKFLGNGKLTKKLNVEACMFSQSAKTKIEAVGGVAKVCDCCSNEEKKA